MLVFYELNINETRDKAARSDSLSKKIVIIICGWSLSCFGSTILYRIYKSYSEILVILEYK